MHIQNNQRINFYSRQQGAVLVISLVILMILTVIGLSSVNTSIMQTLMSANSQYQIKAMNSAERALKTGEDQIEAIVADPSTYNFEGILNDAFYGLSQPIDAHNIDWDDNELVFIHDSDNDSNTDDMYAVEYLGLKELPGESVAMSSGDSNIKGGFVYTYRVTARSASEKGAERIVQSIYVTGDEP